MAGQLTLLIQTMGGRLCPSHYCQPPGLKMLSTPLFQKVAKVARVLLFLFVLASGPAEIEIQFELGSNLQFKLSRQKMCVSMVENVDKKSNHRSGSNISSHVVFIYSLLIAFTLAVLLGIFVTLMQKKYEAQLAKNDIVQSKPVAGKLFFGLKLQLNSCFL